MTTKPPRTPAAPRNRAVVIVDVVVSIALVVVSIVLGLAVAVTAGLYPQDLATYCAGRSVTGLSCNGDFVTGVTYTIIGISIFSVAFGIGMMIVRFVQKRYGWYWPLIGAALTLAAIYGGTALIAPAFN